MDMSTFLPSASQERRDTETLHSATSGMYKEGLYLRERFIK